MEGSEEPSSDPVRDRWDQVVADAETTAQQYRNAGWTVVELHPGDVTVLTGAPGEDPAEAATPQDIGLDVVVPGDEYDRVRDHIADRTFDSYEVFRAVDSGVVFALLVVESADGDVAVLVPVYYRLAELEDLREVAEDRGLYTHIRRLDVDEAVTFTHREPEPFFPDEGDREETEDGEPTPAG